MEPLIKPIQPELPHTAKLSSTFKTEIIPEAFRSRESNWTYDHVGLIHWGGNPKKKTLINISCAARSHSLTGSAKSWSEVGLSPNDRLDASVPNRAPYLVWRFGTSNVGVNPSVELSSRVGESHQQSCLPSGGNPIIGIWKKPGRGKLPGVHPPVGSAC